MQTTKIRIPCSDDYAEIDAQGLIYLDGELLGSLQFDTTPTATYYLAIDIDGNSFRSTSAKHAIRRLVWSLI